MWRRVYGDELTFARSSLDYDIKLDALRRMLERHIEIKHDRLVASGVCGCGLKRWLPPHLWHDFAGIPVGPRSTTTGPLWMRL